MAATHDAIVSSFIEAAPPGQLDKVYQDIKVLLGNKSDDSPSHEAAFRKYNELQYATTNLPGGADQVLICKHNALGQDRYYDTASSTSFAFNHISQTASAAQTHVLDSLHVDIVRSLCKSLSTHSAEHYPASTTGVYPSRDGESVVLVTVANKYSLNNFWSGRWRSEYAYSSQTGAINGSIKVDVHYFEDGNVRMQTDKQVSITSLAASATASEIIRQIAQTEKAYQQDLNRGFSTLNEEAFKNLRRQLPITRQKVEWDKISGYRLGQDIAGQNH